MKTLSVTGLRKAWFVLSGVTVLASIIALAVWGLKQGIEFTGGSLLVMRFQNRPTIVEASAVMQATPNVAIGEIIAQPVENTDMQFRLRSLDGEEAAAVVANLVAKYPGASELSFDAIGPVIGQELRQKSIEGLIVIFLAIMAYVAFAFRQVL